MRPRRPPVKPATAQATAAAPGLPPPPVDEGWPRSYASGDTPTKIYQPQLESWDGFTLKASAAVEVDPVGGEPVFGIAQMTARTTVDYAARTVKLDDVKLPSAQIPFRSAEAVRVSRARARSGGETGGVDRAGRGSRRTSRSRRSRMQPRPYRSETSHRPSFSLCSRRCWSTSTATRATVRSRTPRSRA